MKSTPGPDCSICVHKKRRQIEDALIQGVPVRDIEGRFGVPKSTADRHKNGCMAEMVLAAEEAHAIEMVEDGRDIVDRCSRLHDEAVALLVKARDGEDWLAAAPFINAALKALELEGKLRGRLGGPSVAIQNNTQVNVNGGPPPPWYLAATRGAAKADETLARWLLDAGGGDSFDECAENARRNLEDAAGRWCE